MSNVEIVALAVALGYRRSQFRVDGEDAKVVDAVAAAFRAGEKVDAIDVFEAADGSRVIADGHHRLAGAAKSEQPNVSVRVHLGSLSNVFDFASGNVGNQTAFTTLDDKRSGARKALLADAVCLDAPRSNRVIGDFWKLDHKTIGKIRAELESTGEIPQSKERTGADGRTTRMKRANTEAAATKPAFVPETPDEAAAFARFNALPDAEPTRPPPARADTLMSGADLAAKTIQTRGAEPTSVPADDDDDELGEEPWDVNVELADVSEALIRIERAADERARRIMVLFFEGWIHRIKERRNVGAFG